MKVVVTGGSGFIGSYLIKELEKKGYIVSNIDLKVGKDIRKREDCIESFFEAESIVHLAARVDIQDSIKYPILYNDTNVVGTLQLLSLAEFYKLKKFIYISSAAVKDPLSPYGIQKLSAELYCEFYRLYYGVPVVSIRPFNVYGKGNGKGVIDIWSDSIDKDTSPIVYGGTQSRDFIYIDDVVNSIVTSLESSFTGVCEVGTGVSTTIAELCNLVLKLKKSDLNPIYRESREGEISYSRCEDSRFSTLYSLEKGLKKYLES